MKENIKTKNYIDMELESESDSDSDSDNGIYIDIDNERINQIVIITNKIFLTQ